MIIRLKVIPVISALIVVCACNEPNVQPATNDNEDIASNFTVMAFDQGHNIVAIRFSDTPRISDKDIDQLQEVTFVSIANATSIPGNIDRLPKLARLSIDAPELKELPASIGSLRTLKEISIYSASITSLPETFRYADALETIMVKKVETEFFQAIAILPSIKLLQVWEPTHLPDKFPPMKSLISLDLQDIDYIPALGGLTNLEELSITGGSITSLPGDIGTLKKLNTINFQYLHTPLTIGDEIANCSAMERFLLSHNAGIVLPSRLGDMKGIKKIYLYDNHIESIPESIGELSLLDDLSISAEDITSLPASIGQLTSLTSFAAVGSSLGSVPEEIGQLTNLEFLAFSGNKLREIPASVGNLKKLRRFHIDENQIVSIPGSIGQLTDLFSLALHKNQLTGIPVDDMKSLTNLSYISLVGNEIPLEEIETLKAALPKCNFEE